MPSRATYVAADAAAITVSLVIAHLLRFGVSAALLPGPNVPYVLVAVFAVPGVAGASWRSPAATTG